MSFYNSEFFAGCESLMEDETNLPAEDLPVEEAVVEQQEAADNAQEVVEDAAAVEETHEAAEQMFAKFDEIDRMIAYVGQYGVDKSFLSLCNYNDILNRSFGLGLPATESFDEDGDPNSATSQAAMEGLKEAASKIWEWIKKVCAKIRDWFKSAWAKIKGWFSKKAEDVEQKAKDAAQGPDVPEPEKSEPAKQAAQQEVADPNSLDQAAKKLSNAVKQKQSRTKAQGNKQEEEKPETLVQKREWLKQQIAFKKSKAGSIPRKNLLKVASTASTLKNVIELLKADEAEATAALKRAQDVLDTANHDLDSYNFGNVVQSEGYKKTLYEKQKNARKAVWDAADKQRECTATIEAARALLAEADETRKAVEKANEEKTKRKTPDGSFEKVDKMAEAAKDKKAS